MLRMQGIRMTKKHCWLRLRFHKWVILGGHGWTCIECGAFDNS